LRDQTGDADPAVARAAALVASVPPLAPSAEQERRVRRAVLLAGEPRRARLGLLLRPGIALAVLCLAGAVAAATVGRGLVGRAYQRLVGVEAPHDIRARDHRGAPHAVPDAPPAAVAVSAPAAPSPVPAAEEPTAQPALDLAPPPTTVRHTAHGSPRAAAHGAPAAVKTPPAPEPAPPVAPAPQETALVMKAVRALRRQHQPAQAGALLDEYLRRFPQGALAEEALALAIEAASARGDGRAAVLARDYLRRYPHGRFERAARAAAE
jgi:hypothetical protein